MPVFTHGFRERSVGFRIWAGLTKDDVKHHGPRSGLGQAVKPGLHAVHAAMGGWDLIGLTVGWQVEANDCEVGVVEDRWLHESMVCNVS